MFLAESAVNGEPQIFEGEQVMDSDESNRICMKRVQRTERVNMVQKLRDEESKKIEEEERPLFM